jgi:RND family efflux transporter MFP subunit
MNLIKMYWIKIIVVIVVAGFGLGIVSRVQQNKEDNGSIAGIEQANEVILETVANLSKNLTPLPLIGKVGAQAEVVVQSETQGQVITVFYELGDTVQAGTVIAQLDSITQKAAVSSAIAGVNSARANYDKVRFGARVEELAILKVKLENSKAALTDARSATVNSINSAFDLADDAITNKTDIMFRNQNTPNPELNFVSGFGPEEQIENQRVALGQTLTIWRGQMSTLNTEINLDAQIEVAEINLNHVADYLDLLADLTSRLIPGSGLTQSSIDLYKANTLAARVNINTSLSSVSGSKSALRTSTTSLDVAQKEYDLALSGARSEDLDSARAALDQATAALNSAQVGLEKTAVRSPIAGTITELDLERGDFVSIFSPVVKISNNSRLEITTFITSQDRKDITVGNQALIEGTLEGAVVNIAPSLDPKTKKIEVKIFVNENNAELVNGQSVSLAVNRTNKEFAAGENLFVPLSALKITSLGVSVFTVVEGKLVSIPVKEGPLVGNRVLIEEGLTPEMEIVVDARGFREGQEVSIK